MLETTKTKRRIIVVNKDDLPRNLDIENLDDIVFTNTINYEGIDSLKNKIRELFNFGSIDIKDFNYVSNVSSLNRLEEAKDSLNDIKRGLKNKVTIDMLEIDLKNIWIILGEIIGETYTEELLDSLFKNFCVGK